MFLCILSCTCFKISPLFSLPLIFSGCGSIAVEGLKKIRSTVLVLDGAGDLLQGLQYSRALFTELHPYPWVPLSLFLALFFGVSVSLLASTSRQAPPCTANVSCLTAHQKKINWIYVFLSIKFANLSAPKCC